VTCSTRETIATDSRRTGGAGWWDCTRRPVPDGRPSGRVFVSYASQDGKVAARLCEALDRLHRTAEGDAVFKAMRAGLGDSAAYQYAQIEAGRGHVAQALDWLAMAYKLKDAGLSFMRVDPFMDPPRMALRFLVLYKALKFPDWGYARRPNRGAATRAGLATGNTTTRRTHWPPWAGGNH